MSAGSIKGIRFEADVALDGRRQHYAAWVAVRNGYAYQLLVFGDQSRASDVNQLQAKLLQNLRQIDPERIAHADAQQVVARYESKAYGYSIDLSGLGWMTWKAADTAFPGADFGALRGSAVMAVTPILLPARYGSGVAQVGDVTGVRERWSSRRVRNEAVQNWKS